MQTLIFEELTFEENILVAGMLAKLYSELDSESPVRQWGYNIPNRALLFGDTTWTFGPHRMRTADGEIPGVSITIVRGAYGPNPQPNENYFFPLTSFRKMKLSIVGCRM